MSTKTTTNNVQQIPAWMEKAGQDLWGRAVDYANVDPDKLPQYKGERTAEFSPDQMRVMDWARSRMDPTKNADYGRLDKAVAARESIMNDPTGGAKDIGYRAMGTPVLAGTQMAGTQMAGTAKVDRSSIRDAVAERVGTDDFTQAYNKYANPYDEAVVSKTMADMGRQRLIDRQANEDAALGAGAFGGTRHGVVDAEYDRNYFDRLSAATAGLRRQGFTDAAGIYQADAARKLEAAKSNQGTVLEASKANQASDLAAALQDARLETDTSHLNATQLNDTSKFNAGALNNASQFNANLMNENNKFDIQNWYQTQLANQQNQNTGADRRLRAANDVTDAIGAGAQYTRDAMSDLERQGLNQQTLKQRMLDTAYADWFDAKEEPFQRLQFLSSILNATPYTKVSTSTQTQSQNPWTTALGAGLSAAGVAGGMGWKPFGK